MTAPCRIRSDRQTVPVADSWIDEDDMTGAIQKSFENDQRKTFYSV